MALHIATLHSAREAFMKAQTSEKNQNCIKKQTWQTQERYEIGKEVYYKQDIDEQWKELVNVLGQDGTVVFLWHESRFIKAHACCVQPVKSTLHIIPENENQNKNIDQVQEDKNSRSISESDSDSEMDNNISKTPSSKSDQHNDNTTNPFSLYSPSLPSTLLPPPPSPSSKEQTLEATNTVKQKQTTLPSHSSHTPVQANSIISFNTDNINYKAKVLNRAGKASEKYKSCYNIEYLSPDHLMGQQTWTDLDNIDITSVGNKPETTKTDKMLLTNSQTLDNLDNTDIKFAGNKPETTKTDKILLTNSQTFNIAKKKELKSWEDNNVHEVVPYNNQKCISVCWVCSLKWNSDETSKPKAWLVARGFEEENLHEVPKDSPTCGKDTFWVTLAIIGTYKWELRSIDIKTAFLQGNKLSRDVYFNLL